MGKTMLVTNSMTAIQSINATRPSCNVTTAINDSDAAFTPSRTAPAVAELRIRYHNLILIPPFRKTVFDLYLIQS
jgi:hypothetical protein